MIKKTKLHIFDEVNVAFEGLEKHHINKIIKKTKLMIKGAFHTAEYKMKLTDGMESQFFSSGRTYFYMLDKVLPMVEDLGYEISIEDYRESITKPLHIDKTFIAYTGLELFWYQVEAVNKLIDAERGVFELPTSAGKGLLAAVITKVYEPQLDFVIIVPTEKLVKQVYADCELVGLDIGHITGKMSKKKREVEWGKTHMVCTWQLLKNNRHRLEHFGGLIYDEMHVMG
ncbi:DEAD/DEAH box helicase family protein, partial [Candidatus Babeliales bacterium]|nr:DEAD/DEAH box helicase family protein [Candidatus Babeliales bacterium]